MERLLSGCVRAVWLPPVSIKLLNQRDDPTFEREEGGFHASDGADDSAHTTHTH